MKMNEIKQKEIEELKNAERNEINKAKSRRILTVRLLLENYTIPQVMQITNSSEKTVYNCRNRYKAGGIANLTTKPNTGRINKLTQEQEQDLYETIKTKQPNQVGFAPFANWTSSLAAQWIKSNFGVEFSSRGVRNLFERIGLSYTRPTYTLKKADPEKQAAFIED
jgi:putative transposase